MPRVLRARGLECLGMPTRRWPPLPIMSFLATRPFSTSLAPRFLDDNWLRKKIWKQDDSEAEYEKALKAAYEDEALPDKWEEETSKAPKAGKSRRRPAWRTTLNRVLPPQRSEAESEAVVQEDLEYRAAEELGHLVRIAPARSWWTQEGFWGPESRFSGFASNSSVQDKEPLAVYLRRALIELLALQESGQFADMATKKWRLGKKQDMDHTLSIGVRVVDGKPQLKGNISRVVESIKIKNAEADAAAEPPQIISRTEAQQMMKKWDPSWESVSLDDSMKFMLRKRLYQLTGNLISDSKAGAARTVKHLLTLACKRPQEVKLADELKRSGQLKKLPNVQVYAKKIRFIQKEVKVGRWKVIKEELRKRKLPILGAGGLSGPVERRWLLEK